MFDSTKLKTRTYQTVEQQMLKQKEDLEIKEEMKKLLIDKKENYARYVREMHLPSKSQKKEQELQSLISQLHHPVRNPIKYPPGTKFEGMARSQTISRGRGSLSRGRFEGDTDDDHMSPTDRAKKRISLYRSNRPPIPMPSRQ